MSDPTAPHDPQDEQVDPRALVGMSTVLYAVFTGVGLGLMAWQDLSPTRAIFGDGERLVHDTLLGAGTGLGVVLLTWLTRNLGPVKRLNHELGGLLGTPGTGAIAALAVTSAVGEEVLFRGGLQPLIGFWPTVIVFGLLHGGTQRRLRAWALFATAAGALLGWLALTTGNLLAPILCHLTVNYFNLHVLAAEQAPTRD